MSPILLVEDNVPFAKLLIQRLRAGLSSEIHWVKTREDAETAIRQNPDFEAAVIDFFLPDSENGTLIDHIHASEIPVLVMTASADKEVRNLVWSKKVVDYVLKGDENSLDYIVESLLRLRENPFFQVMVVDDSKTFLNLVAKLLVRQKFNVVTAENAEKALELLEVNPEIKLMISDYEMDGITGFDLCRKIRNRYKKDELAIIGLSAVEDKDVAAKFLKSGANDFLVKQNFSTEEFYCRVNHCIDTIKLFNRIKKASHTDFLSGLYNRRYFFEMGKKLFENSARKQISLTCAMIDIDHFKSVNDTFGHDIGDLVIQKVSKILSQSLRQSDIVARVGGEEFCVLAVNMEKRAAFEFFDEIRRKVNQKVAIFKNKELNRRISVSIGVAAGNFFGLEEMILSADQQLYEAKNSGRNQVACNQCNPNKTT